MNLEGIDLVEENTSEPSNPGKKETWENSNIPFLEAYKKHPCLWDITLPTYRNNPVARDIALLAMLNELRETLKRPQLQMKKVVSRLQTMKKDFVLEWKNVQDSKGQYKSKYAWYDFADSFLGQMESRKLHAYTKTYSRKRKASESAPNSATNGKSTTYTYFDVRKENQFDEFGKEVAEDLRKMGLCEGYALYQEMQSLINERRNDLLQKDQNIGTAMNTQTQPYITNVKTINEVESVPTTVKKEEFVTEIEMLPAPVIPMRIQDASNKRTYGSRKPPK